MPLQAKEWVYDLSGKVKIPIYQGVKNCPKCGSEMMWNDQPQPSRQEKHKVSKDRHCYITSFDAQIKDGVVLTMDEYIEVTCGDCNYAWAEACIDYDSPKVFALLNELFGILPILSEHVELEFAAEAAELEAKAKESVALMKAGTITLGPDGYPDHRVKAITDAEYVIEVDGRSNWEKESVGSVQPFSMLSPEDQAQREVDALTPVLDTPEETVLPTKKEKFFRRLLRWLNPWGYRW